MVSHLEEHAGRSDVTRHGSVSHSHHQPLRDRDNLKAISELAHVPAVRAQDARQCKSITVLAILFPQRLNGPW